MDRRARSAPFATLAGGGSWTEQFAHLRVDARVLVQGRRSRWLRLPFSQAFLLVLCYRCNRAAYLRFGRGWRVARTLTSPLELLLRPFLPSELDYRADLGPGLRILHPQLGVVVSGGVTAGAGLILAGGNAIGDGSPHLGAHVELGVNAVVLGDVRLGDHVVVGAGAVVTRDFAGPGALVGVPARPVEPA